MGIKNVIFEPAGLVGVKPRIVYIDTESTLLQVTAPNFLIGAKPWGYTPLQTDLCAVSYLSGGLPESQFFSVSINGTVATLVPQFNNSFVGIKTVTDDYIVTAADNQFLILCNKATDMTITYPETSTENLPLGFTVGVANINTGVVNTFVQGSDVLLGHWRLFTGGSASVKKVVAGNPNTYLISGGSVYVTVPYSITISEGGFFAPLEYSIVRVPFFPFSTLTAFDVQSQATSIEFYMMINDVIIPGSEKTVTTENTLNNFLTAPNIAQNDDVLSLQLVSVTAPEYLRITVYAAQPTNY